MGRQKHIEVLLIFREKKKENNISKSKFLVELYYFLSLAILLPIYGYVGPRHRLRLLCHAFNHRLVLFNWLCVQSLIVHSLFLRQETYPTRLCLIFLIVRILSFILVCFWVPVLVFPSRKFMPSMIRDILRWTLQMSLHWCCRALISHINSRTYPRSYKSSSAVFRYITIRHIVFYAIHRKYLENHWRCIPFNWLSFLYF